MESRLQWILAQFTRRLWFRAAMFGAMAVATALVSALTTRYFPQYMGGVIGAESVEGILKILASSMLAVATFSLGTMVAAFSAASSNATPRAAKLLIEDPTSQNALATFIGAFIFSLIGIIALSAGYYGPGGRAVLFVVTIIVVLVIIMTFFKWIDYVSNLGRLSAVIGKVEQAAAKAVRARHDAPHMGGLPARPIPDDAVPLTCAMIGYVQHLDVAALSQIAAQQKAEIHVNKLAGSFADGCQPLAWLTWTPNDEQQRELCRAFIIGSERSFDQDPRFGLIVLSEIASRALSPGVNDPGTAIDVIGRIVRILAIWAEPRHADARKVRCPNVYIPAVPASDLFDDAFMPIARDGAGMLEVGARLQKAFRSLAEMGGADFCKAAKRHSSAALLRARQAMTLQEDLDALERLADAVGRARPPDREGADA